MAYLNTTFVPSFLDRIRSVASPLLVRIKHYRLYRKTLNELSALTNRELADLGLSRAGLQIKAWDSAKG